MAREPEDKNTRGERGGHLYQRVYLLAGSRAACWEVTKDKSVVNDRSPSDVVEIDDGDVGVECHGG